MKRCMIERDLPNIGAAPPDALAGAAGTSNSALAELAPKIQWEHSYVAGNKTFCVYLADSEDVIRRHAELSGIPIKSITEVQQIIDPLTANN